MVEIDEQIRLIDRVRKVISRGPLFWFTPQEIIREIYFDCEEMFSDSSITARCRDLRKPKFGGYTVNQRPRAGCRAHEYQLIEAEQVKAA